MTVHKDHSLSYYDIFTQVWNRTHVTLITTATYMSWDKNEQNIFNRALERFRIKDMEQFMKELNI